MPDNTLQLRASCQGQNKEGFIQGPGLRKHRKPGNTIAYAMGDAGNQDVATFIPQPLKKEPCGKKDQ